MKTKIIIALLLLMCFAYFTLKEAKSGLTISGSESEISFDKTKWQIKEELDYPFRNQMLKDLMSNQNLREIKKDQVIELLGQPDRSDNDYLFYRIEQKRLLLFPLHTKTLIIKLSQDSTKNKVMVHE